MLKTETKILLCATLLAFSAPLVAAETEEEVHCLGQVGCGLRMLETFDSVLQVEDHERLAARLLAEPVAPVRKWNRLLSFRPGDGQAAALAIYAVEQHWQPSLPAPATDLDRLQWLDLWKTHNPREPEAWRRWATESAAERGAGAVLAELESALAAQPENGAIRSALLIELQRSGASSRFRPATSGARTYPPGRSAPRSSVVSPRASCSPTSATLSSAR